MRHHTFGRDVVLVAWLLVASLIAVVQPASVALASDQSNTARLVRTFDLDELSISNPGGLAFSTADDTFHVLESIRGASDVAVKQISSHEVAKGLARVAAQVTHPVNVTYDDVYDRLLMYATPMNHIIAVATKPSGDLEPESLSRTNAHSFGVSQPKGLAVDPATGDLLVLDLGGPKIVRIAVGSDGSFLEASGEVQLLGLTDPTSLAVDPNTGHLFVASSTQPHVYELSTNGDLLATWDISEAEISTPGGMVFAASGDLTDAPSQVSLYITDTGDAGPSASHYGERVASVGTSLRVLAASEPSQSEGQIVEVSLVEPQVTATATETFAATMIQEIQSFNWSPPSPDTSGVVYLPATNTLLAVDGEVNEMPIYAGANVFESMLNGNLIDTWTTLDFGNNEPTGVSVDPSDGTLYISRDTPPKEVYVWDPGSNGTYETTDNINSFVTADFGATDPEGVSYAVGMNRLFIADGLNNEIYQLSPGSNGVFDGVAPAGDDVVVDNFDILSMGMEDPEGVAYNPDTGTLYIGGKTRNLGSYNFDTILEVTTSGSLVRYIDVSDVNPGRQNRRQKLSGLAYGPGSGNPSEMVLYIADRGEDNNKDPNENDGRIYEVTLPAGGGGPVNHPPVAVNDQVTTSENNAVNVDVADNDTDQDGNLDLSTVSTVAPGPPNGVTSDNNNGTIDYTPDPGFNGTDNFDYEICDTDGLCDTATVTVTVTQPNDPPTANPDSASTNEDSSVVINVASNDTDPQGNGTLDQSSVVTVSGPSNGGTTDNGNGTITYDPDPNYNGPDQFNYEICDDLGLCDTAVVDVTVDPVADPPAANPDTASTPANTPVTINVASNDSDPDGDLDLSSVSTVSGPANGNTVDNADGSIEYTPALDYSGSDSFTYEICDNTTPTWQCDQAQVDVTISGDQVLYVTSTSGGNVGGVSFKDEDILAFDTSTGTWSMYFDGSDVGLGTGGQEVDGFHLETDGSILLTFGAPTSVSGAGSVDDHDIVRFMPTSTGTNTSGTYEMFFNGEDHGLTTNGEDIDAFGFAPGGDLVVSTRGSYSVPGLSGKDADLITFNGSTWSLYMDGISVGLDGGNTEDVTATWIDGNGDVYLSVRSSYTVPNLSGDADDIFVCDPPGSAPISSCTFTLFWDGGQDGFGGEALNGMFISGGGGGGGPTNSPPNAVDDNAVTPVSTPVLVNVASNDTDPDGNLDPSTAATNTGPSNGGTSDNGDGTIIYTPTPGYTGSDSFTYDICDTDGACDTATVNVTVTQPNDPPNAVDDNATTDEDNAVIVDVSLNDGDPDGNLDPSTAATQTGPSNGATTDNGDGTITYTPNLNFNGGDSFTYVICDTLGACDAASVDVTVDPINDQPVATDDSASTSIDTSVVVNVASNDSDVDGNLVASSAAPTSDPPNGTAAGNGDGTITYTPDPGYSGPDSFTYEICDSGALCDSATVDVNVTGGGGGGQVVYLSSTSGGSVGGVSFKDEDILAFDTGTSTWSMYFDGSDVGLGASGQELDAFHLNSDGSILLSLGADGTVPDVGAVQDHDILRFIPTSTGDNTSGTYEMYFNGEDHDLTDNGEDIDSIGIAPDGRLVVSLRGYYSVPNVSGTDVDLLAFDFGTGTWSLYMDGVAVGLDAGNTEDLSATWIDSNGDIYMSVRSSFVVPGLSGDSADVFACAPQNSNPITSCTYSMFWDGSVNDFGSESINGLSING